MLVVGERRRRNCSSSTSVMILSFPVVSNGKRFLWEAENCRMTVDCSDGGSLHEFQRTLKTGHTTLCRFIYVYVCIFCVYLFPTAYLSYCCNTVGWTWWDWSLILRTYLPSVHWHCWLGHLTRKNPIPDMSYNVFGGTLILTGLNSFCIKFISVYGLLTTTVCGC